jgi:putative addiction module component (TIGR02574 family)
MSTDQIIREAMALPPQQRAELAEKLLSSIGDAEQEQIDSAWVEEIERRIDAYEAGSEKSQPADEVFRTIRDRLRRG